MVALYLAYACHSWVVNSFMGTFVGKKIRASEVMGFRVGDRVSHSKLGTRVGKILYFAELSRAIYALVDYGDRKRPELITDLLPIREDIYIGTEEI